MNTLYFWQGTSGKQEYEEGMRDEIGYRDVSASKKKLQKCKHFPVLYTIRVDFFMLSFPPNHI